MRPAHKVARHVANTLGIPLLSLEEGYLRTGFVTCELFGNNQHSRLCQWSRHWSHASTENAPVKIKSTFPIMSVWGAAYYLARDIFSSSDDEKLFHRKRENPIALSMSWVMHILARLAARVMETRTRRQLLSNRKRPFILVPLQVPSDSQIQSASRGWSNEALIRKTIEALAQSQDGQDLVFKLHPLDRKGRQHRKNIKHWAKRLGVSQNVRVINSGKLGQITANASGMIVINSTSAFSALHQNKPVLVLGDAIYRHNDIVTVGHSAKDIDDFLRFRTSRHPRDIQTFVHAVQQEALLPGDFYNARGRQAAVTAISQKIDELVRTTEYAMTAAE